MGRNMEIKHNGDFGEYKLHKQHNISEYLENEATDWVIGSIEDHFQAEIKELTIQQIEEVVKEYENCDDQYIAMALRNSISQWENDNDQYVL